MNGGCLLSDILHTCFSQRGCLEISPTDWFYQQGRNSTLQMAKRRPRKPLWQGLIEPSREMPSNKIALWNAMFCLRSRGSPSCVFQANSVLEFYTIHQGLLLFQEASCLQIFVALKCSPLGTNEGLVRDRQNCFSVFGIGPGSQCPTNVLPFRQCAEDSPSCFKGWTQSSRNDETSSNNLI